MWEGDGSNPAQSTKKFFRDLEKQISHAAHTPKPHLHIKTMTSLRYESIFRFFLRVTKYSILIDSLLSLGIIPAI